MAGWVKLHRSITDNPYWLSEPFTRGQAWVDMLLIANASPGFIRKQGVRIDLSRGDIGWSELELSKRWEWSRGKVRRFFDELEKDGMIERKNSDKTDRRMFVVSILNYCKYQDKHAGDDTGDSTSDDTGDGQATVQEVRSKEVRSKDIGGEKSPEKQKPKHFAPPKLEEIREYCQERQNSVSPERFFSFYESKGWMVGKNKMKNWKAAIATWEGGAKSPSAERTCKTCDYDHRPGYCDHKTPEQRNNCQSWTAVKA